MLTYADVCKVLFATCFDADEFESLARFVNKRVQCEIKGNRVTIEETADQAADSKAAGASSHSSAMSGLKVHL
jgi:hypothetical protein